LQKKYLIYLFVVLIGSANYSGFLSAQQQDLYLDLFFSKNTIEALTVKEKLLVSTLDG